MSSIKFPISKTVLLTGAGFSHNFGGFLSKNMWAEIHNRYQRYSAGLKEDGLRRLLKDKFNYEEIYEEVITSNQFTSDEKRFFVESVLGAYESLDGVIAGFYTREKNYKVNIELNDVLGLLQRISGKSEEKGFFFTLNQDLFVERYFDSIHPIPPYIKFSDERKIKPTSRLTDRDYGRVPSKDELEIWKGDINNLDKLLYIKLHGSFDWRDTNNQRKLIIGTNKPDSISREPVFAWYFELFKEALSQPNCHLLIIGYGFGDEHINKVIHDSIKANNLKVYVISPEDPKSFNENTLPVHDPVKNSIWDALSGYYPYSLEDLFPVGGSSQHYENLVKDFFV